MKALGIIGIVVVTSLSIACVSVSSVQLRPEEASVLHVGQRASLTVPSGSDFSIGSAGTALILVQQERREGRTIYVYRAAQPGDQTLVATPRESGSDGCVSCITVHYFVKVVQ